MDQKTITPKKIAVLLTCFLILLYLYLTADRLLHLATYQWHNNKIITTQISGITNTSHREMYTANVKLKIYNGKWQWIIGYTCSAKTLVYSTERPEEMNHWQVIEMNRREIILQNAGKKIILNHRCE